MAEGVRWILLYGPERPSLSFHRIECCDHELFSIMSRLDDDTRLAGARAHHKPTRFFHSSHKLRHSTARGHAHQAMRTDLPGVARTFHEE